jgi:hypothetical protein
LSKKKKNVLILLTTLLFFGALLFNLKYPLMSETTAEPKVAQESTAKDKTDIKIAEDALNKDSPGDKDIPVSKDAEEDKDTSVVKDTPEDKDSKPKETKTDTSSSNQTPTKKTDNQVTKQEPKPEPKQEPKPKPKPKPEPKPEPKPQPKPTLKPFVVPASNSFASVSQSTNPGRVELGIALDSSRDDYETQLSELYNVIASAVGSQIATEAVNYARTKTDAHIALDKEWHIQSRQLEIGSTWGSWGVSFNSWRKY